jgi:hypothetical protein
MSHKKSLVMTINWFSQGDDHKYVVNSNFDKQLFSNKRWQKMWGGTFLKFSFKMVFGWIIQIKT